ncbi:unnamed protein product [Spirodela intermedia]|uniref:Reverse transcriptase RNase H-like domain-containing protein n=1 Tax=Spirodela intermedia TaxID=51605 RepID=A0A7I8KA34_SPIIN|nr:unnamed protein product [Spirodela intermedia]
MDFNGQFYDTPIILGRPFLHTAKMNIDFSTSITKISCGDQSVEIKIFEVSNDLKKSQVYDCHIIDLLDDFDDPDGVVLGHIVSERGLEVDRAKIDIICKMKPPNSVKQIRSFLGHVGYYRKFIQDFSKISKPLTMLLSKNVPFNFDEKCFESFSEIKRLLTEAPILQAPDWSLPFEIMCDASNYAMGAVLGQTKESKPIVISYASKTISDAQLNYTKTEKELLAIVFSLERFRSYILRAKIIIYTDHAALKYLLNKKDAKPRLLR